MMNKKNNPVASENKDDSVSTDINPQENLEPDSSNDALESYLNREVSTEQGDIPEKPDKKLSKNTKWISIGALTVIVLVGILCLLIFLPKSSEDEETDLGTDINLSVDDNGVHQAEVVLDENGEIANNSFGTLISYTPSDISQIDLENTSGSYTITAYTPPSSENEDEGDASDESTEDDSDATVYTLVGFEDIPIQDGMPDSIANDVAAIDFTSVANVSGKNASDFGFDSPRATVKTTFTDGTTSTVTVGSDVPSSLCTYIMFGSSSTIYVVDSEAVDSLLYSVLDLVSLTVNDSADETENSEFKSVTISGAGFDSDIAIKQNDDAAIDSTYVMTSPKKMFVNETEGANIAGSIRGLYADKAVCVNPSSSQLKDYGLSNPYAKITAVYADETITLLASKPENESLYLMQDGGKIIYSVAASSVSWATTNVSKLTSELILDVNKSAISKITVTDESGSYTFNVATATSTVTNDQGEEEEVEQTTAEYNGKTLDSTNFSVFMQNLAGMQNASAASEKANSKPVLTVTYSYSTGRADDCIKLYDTGSTKLIATLNSDTAGLVYKSYFTKFTDSIQDLIKGDTVSSF